MNERPGVGQRVRWRRRIYTVVKVDGDTITVANEQRTEYVGVGYRELQPAPPKRRMPGQP